MKPNDIEKPNVYHIRILYRMLCIYPQKIVTAYNIANHYKDLNNRTLYQRALIDLEEYEHARKGVLNTEKLQYKIFAQSPNIKKIQTKLIKEEKENMKMLEYKDYQKFFEEIWSKFVKK